MLNMMLARRSTRALFRTSSRVSSWLATRSASSEAATTSAIDSKLEEFKGKWEEVAPLLPFPQLPRAFLNKRPEPSVTIPEKLTFNFYMPHALEIDAKQVDMVIVPATTGQMGVLPGHVPTVAQLRPGLLSVHDGKETQQYFVSSGFAFIHANSVTDVCAVEAVPLDQLDPEAVKKGLAMYTDKLNTASTELEKAEAQIGIEVHSAMSGALGL